MRTVALITEAARLGRPTPVDLGPDWEALAQPQPDYVFDQEARW